MTDFKYNKVLLVFIIIGLIGALTVCWQRHVIEENNSRVEMVMEYEDLIELAQLEGHDVPDLMRKFKEAGITTLAVYETTLEKLNKSGKVTAVPGSQILSQYRTGALSDPGWRTLVETGRIQAEDVYVTGQQPQVFEEVKEDLIRRLSPERVSVLSDGGRQILAVKANYEKVIKWNLGLPTDEMREVAGYGFYVMARPTNYSKVRPDDVNAVFRRLSGIDKVSGLMFVAQEALGYPNLLPLTVEQVKARGLTLVLIEDPSQLQFYKQEGLLPMVAADNYQAARAYTIPKDEQPKMKVQDAILRWATTDDDRNIRVNLLRKFDKPDVGKNLVETNLEYISGVKQALQAKGFTFGPAGTFQPYFASPLLLALVAIGATAAGILLLTLLKPFAPRYQYLLLIIISAALIFPMLKGGGTLARQAVALASAVVFPVLAMTWQIDRWRKITPGSAGIGQVLADGLTGLTLTVFLSLVGGFYLGAILADIRFFLEIEIFRGVKFTIIAPLILITLIFLTRYNVFDNGEKTDGRNIWQQLAGILDCPVKVKSILILAIAAVAAWVYVGRSGHTAGVPVPDVEVRLRHLLEQLLYARPREKEFLIGHPAFLLAVMAVYRRWPQVLYYGLIVLAVIGQVSLVEAFAHMRTPVLMSFVRALTGLGLGAVFGIVAVVGVQVFQYGVSLIGRRPAKNE